MAALAPDRRSSPLRAGSPARRERRARLPRAYYVTAAVLPLALLLAYAAWLAAGSGMLATPTARIGQPAPGFSLVDLDGRPIRLAELAGRPVVLNFWASWCGPCVEEFPLLARAAEQHEGAGLTVIGIVYQDRSEAARQFMARMGAGWPAAMDPGGNVAARYGIHGPPETFFIGSDGVVHGRQIGPLSAADLERQLALILDGRRE